VRDVQGLQEEIDRQGQVIDQLHAERDVLGRQIDTLEDEKSRLEEEKRRRTVEVLKLRGTSHQKGEFPFTIVTNQGIIMVPLSAW